MLCPKCKKQNTEEVNIEFIVDINSIKRSRKCTCGNVFTTFEVISDVHIDNTKLKIVGLTKSKTPKRTAWQDWRFLCYARVYYFNVAFKLKEILLKEKIDIKKLQKDIEILSIKSTSRGKICYEFKDKTNNRKYKFLMHNLKTNSVKKLLENPDYWKNWKIHNQTKENPSKEVKNKEAHQFIKSLNHKKNGIRSEKYDIDFFKKDSFLNIEIKKDPETFWFIWKNIR